MSTQALLRVQKDYYSILKSRFQLLQQQLHLEDRLAGLAHVVYRQTSTSRGHNELANELNALLDDIGRFWQLESEGFRSNLIALNKNLSIQLGNFTWGTVDFVGDLSRHCIYFDTALFTDPIYNAFLMRNHTGGRYLFKDQGETSKQQMFELLLSYMGILDIEIATMADLDAPLALITPITPWSSTDWREFEALATRVACQPFSELLQTEIQSKELLIESVSALTPEELNSFAEAIRKNELFTSIADRHDGWEKFENHANQWPMFPYQTEKVDIPKNRENIARTVEYLRYNISGGSFGTHVSELSAANYRSDVGLHPDLWAVNAHRHVYAASTWNERRPDELSVVAQTLSGRHLVWLENVSVQELVKFRLDGELDSVRNLFRIDRSTLQTANPSDAPKLVEQLAAAVEDEVLSFKHRPQKKGSGRDVLKVCGTAAQLGLSFLAGPIGSVFATLLFPSMNVVELSKRVKDQEESNRELQRNPLNVLSQRYSQRWMRRNRGVLVSNERKA